MEEGKDDEGERERGRERVRRRGDTEDTKKSSKNEKRRLSKGRTEENERKNRDK
jgi:hypothetical protein